MPKSFKNPKITKKTKSKITKKKINRLNRPRFGCSDSTQPTNFENVNCYKNKMNLQ
jgi:hypothetical protein